MAIHNVRDDPRLQYPEEAQKEGIESILSVPWCCGQTPGGAQALHRRSLGVHPGGHHLRAGGGPSAARVLDNIRVSGAYKTSIEALKELRPPLRPVRRTLHE